MVRYANEAPSRDKDAPRINEEITAHRIRLIQADGEMAGVCKVDEALSQARQAGLDLVEISPNADPPVCKILDYGKYKYQVSKKRNEARKKQKTIVVKEIKMRPNIEQHDYDVKTKAAMRFLESGDKVKITLRFRGREMSHQELGEQVLQRVQADFEEFAKVEHAPSFEGRQMIMVLAPK